MQTLKLVRTLLHLAGSLDEVRKLHLDETQRAVNEPLEAGQP